MNNFSNVPENSRLDFLPALLGTQFHIYTHYENRMYDVADECLKGYNGGYWYFAKLENTYGLKELGFMYPETDSEKVVLKGPYEDLEMGPLAAGVSMTIMVLNRLCWSFYNKGEAGEEVAEHCNELINALRHWAFSDEDSVFSAEDKTAIFKFTD